MCVPDMSGFTEFIVRNDLELSKEVIPTLLTGIIESNTIGFEVGDIQGDAVLFYKITDIPKFSEVIEQCRNIYFDFEARIKTIEKLYPDQIKSIIRPSFLGLKFIIHYGEVGVTSIQEKTRIIGEDVIVTFRLMKNSIPLDEYILITEDCLDQYHQIIPAKVLDWATIQEGEDEYEHLGKIRYKFIDLKPLGRMAPQVNQTGSGAL